MTAGFVSKCSILYTISVVINYHCVKRYVHVYVWICVRVCTRIYVHAFSNIIIPYLQIVYKKPYHTIYASLLENRSRFAGAIECYRECLILAAQLPGNRLAVYMYTYVYAQNMIICQDIIT